jgi:hypothetical protein
MTGQRDWVAELMAAGERMGNAVDELHAAREAEEILQAEAPFTCNTCLIKDDCEFAFDLYNLHGECLASK